VRTLRRPLGLTLPAPSYRVVSASPVPRSLARGAVRISDSLVHSVNFTSPTSLGMSHVVAFSSFTLWSKGFLSVHSGCTVS